MAKHTAAASIEFTYRHSINLDDTHLSLVDNNNGNIGSCVNKVADYPIKFGLLQ
ncbi:hypothetical protein [Arsenophonus endosymbiont of Crataerina pallida]|uniref:hypothetical protein n=1 Tax=Arsenophonus endosymbiont of Crataerina pallida TaxID=3066235 RepID=UPI0030CF14B6